jgi:hypothetical protein
MWMSADYYQQQPVPPQAQGGGCMRRGCITGCVVALILCVVLVAGTIYGAVAAGRYISSMRLDNAPCPLMSVGLQVMDQAIDHPNGNSKPDDIEQMRQARSALQAEYNKRCTSSTRV